MTRAQELGITDFPYNEVNEHGGLTYTEHADGWWLRADFHPVHNKLNKIESSTGEEHIFEYNDAGQLTRFSTSRYWLQKEYDSEGVLVYEESSEGVKLDNRKK
jgi:hypothetical protein